MDFDRLYERSAGLAKMLEVRWFHFRALASGSVDDFEVDEEKSVAMHHRMPFLHRSLSYVQAVKTSSRNDLSFVNNNNNKRKRKRKLRGNITSAANAEDATSKNADLLYKLFRHRVRRYNDAYLGSPRRETRSSRTVDLPSAERLAASRSHVPKESMNPELVGANKTNGNGRRPMVVSLFNDCDKQSENENQQQEHDDFEEIGTASKKNAKDRDANGAKTRDDLASPLSSLYDEEFAPIATPHAVSVLSPTKRIPFGSSNIAKHAVSFSTEPHTRVFIHYLSLDSENFPSVQVETKEDRMCPLCFIDARSDYGLLMHCKVTHGGDFFFEAARSEDETLHLSVCRKCPRSSTVKHDHLADFVFVRLKSDVRKDTFVPFVKRPIHKAATLDLATRKRKVRLLQENGAGNSVARRFIPGDEFPLRQYFHSRTNQPMLHGEWEEDSDDEPDDIWLHRMSEELLDDFEDVSAKEKQFMKIWNRFIKSHTIKVDRDLPALCTLFAKKHRGILKKADLRQNFLLHLFNLWDERLVSSSHLLACMVEFDTLTKSQTPTCNILDTKACNNSSSTNGKK